MDTRLKLELRPHLHNKALDRCLMRRNLQRPKMRLKWSLHSYAAEGPRHTITPHPPPPPPVISTCSQLSFNSDWAAGVWRWDPGGDGTEIEIAGWDVSILNARQKNKPQNKPGSVQNSEYHVPWIHLHGCREWPLLRISTVNCNFGRQWVVHRRSVHVIHCSRWDHRLWIMLHKCWISRMNHLPICFIGQCKMWTLLLLYVCNG